MPRHSLTPEDVKTIRERYARGSGESYQQIANDYGCCFETIRAAVRGLTYKKVGGPIHTGPSRWRRPKGEDSALSSLTLAEAEIIRRRHAQGASCRQLAAKFGTSRQTISKVLRGLCYIP